MNLPPLARSQISSEEIYEVFIVNISQTEARIFNNRLYISCPGGNDEDDEDDDDDGKDSRCAGLTAWCVVIRVFTALPGATGVV